MMTDIVQEAVCFLCEHIDKRLDDEYGIDKYGKPITIKTACYRHVDKYIAKERNTIYLNVCIDDVTEANMPTVRLSRIRL